MEDLCGALYTDTVKASYQAYSICCE